MILQKLSMALGLIGFCVLMTGCQSYKNPYEAKQTCLSDVIAQCKQKGWDYAEHDLACRRAADIGIYGLSCAQLRACWAAEQQTKKPR